MQSQVRQRTCTLCIFQYHSFRRPNFQCDVVQRHIYRCIKECSSRLHLQMCYLDMFCCIHRIRHILCTICCFVWTCHTICTPSCHLLIFRILGMICTKWSLYCFEISHPGTSCTRFVQLCLDTDRLCMGHIVIQTKTCQCCTWNTSLKMPKLPIHLRIGKTSVRNHT